MKNIYFVIASLLLLFYVIYNVRREKLSIKESFWWIICSIITLILSIFPKSIDLIAKWFGVAYPPTLMLVFSILFLLFMNFRLSIKISDQNAKIMELIQQISIIKSKNNKR